MVWTLWRHDGFAVSPPSVGDDKQFYSHNHQTDNNRTVYGARVFELVACEGQLEHKHYLVYLDDTAGALRIPPRVYHRSVSCRSGSILLNHAIRDEDYDENNEFSPSLVSETPELKNVLEENSPICVNATREEIERFINTGSITETGLTASELLEKVINEKLIDEMKQMQKVTEEQFVDERGG